MRKQEIIPFISDETMLETGQATLDMIHCMKTLAQAGVNTIIGGNCNAGKSELLGWYAGELQPNQRLIIDDPYNQLRLIARYPNQHPLHAFTEALPMTKDDACGILKTNPNYIIIDELRAASDMYAFLRLLQTGMKGAATTHGQTAHDVLYRLQSQCLYCLRHEQKRAVTDEQCGQFIAQHIDVVITQTMTRHGVRTISQIVEVTGFENGVFTTNHLFKQTGEDEHHKPIHEHVNDISESLQEMIKQAGVTL